MSFLYCCVCNILLQVNEIQSILHACIGLCQRNTPRLNPEESEILWFRLLDSYDHSIFHLLSQLPNRLLFLLFACFLLLAVCVAQDHKYETMAPGDMISSTVYGLCVIMIKTMRGCTLCGVYTLWP